MFFVLFIEITLYKLLYNTIYLMQRGMELGRSGPPKGKQDQRRGLLTAAR